jgi:AraC-like DNA-binding protein
VVDALADVLGAVRINSGVFLDAEFTAPWCIWAKVDAEDCAPFGVTGGHVVAYHYVIEGSLHLEVEGLPAVLVEAGHIVLLPRNDIHILGSEPGLEPIIPAALVQAGPMGGLASIRYGGGGARCRVICGFLACEVPDNPLVQGLPAVLTQGFADAAKAAWVDSSFRLAAAELAAGRLGATSLLARLAELLFAEAVRGYLQDLPPERTGWLAALRDPQIGRALARLHARPGDPWTTEALAEVAGLSRSAFADRFTRLLGQPPMRYLAAWRMQLAASRLHDQQTSLAAIGFALGYESEAAFNRAFKRHHGLPPAAWRKANG